MLAHGPHKNKQQARLGLWGIVYQPLTYEAILVWLLLASLTFSHCSLLLTPVQPPCSLPFLPRLFPVSLISQGLALCLYWVWSPPHRGLSWWSCLRELPPSSFAVLLSCFILLFHSSCHCLNICIYLFTCFFKISYFILEYSWLTMICSLQVYSKVIQLYPYKYPFFFFFTLFQIQFTSLLSASPARMLTPWRQGICLPCSLLYLEPFLVHKRCSKKYLNKKY